MTGSYQFPQVTVRGRPRVVLGVAEIVIRRKIVCRSVSPFALIEAIGGRQKLNRVHAELREIRAAGLSYVEAGKISPFRGTVNQRNHIAKRPCANLAFTRGSGPCPGCWQFINNEPIVRRPVRQGRFILQRPGFAACIAGEQLALAEFHDRGRIPVVVTITGTFRPCGQ